MSLTCRGRPRQLILKTFTTNNVQNDLTPLPCRIWYMIITFIIYAFRALRFMRTRRSHIRGPVGQAESTSRHSQPRLFYANPRRYRRRVCRRPTDSNGGKVASRAATPRVILRMEIVRSSIPSPHLRQRCVDFCQHRRRPELRDDALRLGQMLKG